MARIRNPRAKKYPTKHRSLMKYKKKSKGKKKRR